MLAQSALVEGCNVLVFHNEDMDVLPLSTRQVRQVIRTLMLVRRARGLRW